MGDRISGPAVGIAPAGFVRGDLLIGRPGAAPGPFRAPFTAPPAPGHEDQRAAALVRDERQQEAAVAALLGPDHQLSVPDRNASTRETLGQLIAGVNKLNPAARYQLMVVVRRLGFASDVTEARWLDVTHHPREVALRQLADLLVAGTLQQRDARGQTFLEDLAAMAQRHPIKGVDRARLIEETLKDVMDPATISQAFHDTCTATVIQAKLAQQRPAEYARLLLGLSTGDGKVVLADGRTTLTSANFVDAEDRTLTGNLAQTAFMNLEAQAEGARYDTRQDEMIGPDGHRHSGASTRDLGQVAGEVFADHLATFTVDPTSPQASQTLDVFKGATADRPVLATVALPAIGQHEVQVVGYDPARGEVRVRNPWGVIDAVKASAFQQQLQAVTLPWG